ncbi:hypothetical protein ACFXOL_14705 [Streptomyces californicus]|uniref:hypothetical protein n=1 Tax=Streptomyces TaxID=1883 RepID=UPI0013DC6CE2|nr:hypothetical protein [Streptomyces sp. SID10692]
MTAGGPSPAGGVGREGARVRAAVAGHVRRRAWAEAEEVFGVVLADPEVRRIGALVEAEEMRSGVELRDEFQTFQDRYEEAVRTGDVAVLARICPGKHGRWGRACVLTSGHEGRAPHWGVTSGGPVAWIGSAPDDD